MGSHRVGHDWRDLAAAWVFTIIICSPTIKLLFWWDHIPLTDSNGFLILTERNTLLPRTVLKWLYVNSEFSLHSISLYLLCALEFEIDLKPAFFCTHWSFSFMKRWWTEQSTMNDSKLNCMGLQSRGFFSIVGFPGGSAVKNPPGTQETWVGSLGWEDPLEKGRATRSSILAWEIPRTEEPGSYSSWRLKESDMIEQLTHFQ